MFKEMRHQQIKDILDATSGGDDLSDNDVCDLCYLGQIPSIDPFDAERLKQLHSVVMAGSYPNQDLYGLAHLRRDAEGTVYYKGIRVMTSYPPFLASNQAHETLSRLHSWCIQREQNGEKVSYAAFMMRLALPQTSEKHRHRKDMDRGAR